MSKWTSEQESFLLQNKFEPISVLSKFIGKSELSIRHKLNRLLDTSRKTYTTEDIEYLQKWFPIFGYDFCKRELDIHEETINYLCFKFKIKKNKESFQDFDINDYFSNFHSPYIIYILGFAWADGCLSEASKNSLNFSITLNKLDGMAIENFFSEKYWLHLKWHRYCYISGKEGRTLNGYEIKPSEVVRYSLSDLYFNNFLLKKDYKIKSGASPDKILNILPDNLKYHWWRGYFDGDGYFSCDSHNNSRIGFCSVYDQDWKFAENMAKHLQINYKISRTINKNNQKGSQFLIRRRDDVKKFLDWIYESFDSEKIGLSRKYQKYINWNFKEVKKTSKFIGVCQDGDKWISYYKRNIIGRYNSELAAAEARAEYLKNENSKS